MAGIVSRVVRWLETLEPAETPPKDVAPTSTNPYQPAADRIRTTATWLIGALAAVATVMLAGTQLSTIGALSFADDTVRLVSAVVAALLAVAAVAFAIYRLTFVQAPVDIGLEYVRAEAASVKSKLTRMAAADLGLRANYPTLLAFLDDYDKLRIVEYQAEDRLREEKAKLTASSQEGSAESVEAAQAALERAHADVARLKPQMLNLYQLAGYLAVRSRFDDERRKVLVAALVVAAAIVCFAWAANPPEDESSVTAAVEQRPTEATLSLTVDGVARLTPALGADCVARAADQGIRVIALSGGDSGYSVVIVPEGACKDPVSFTVEKSDGTVRAVEDVL